MALRGHQTLPKNVTYYAEPAVVEACVVRAVRGERGAGGRLRQCVSSPIDHGELLCRY